MYGSFLYRKYHRWTNQAASRVQYSDKRNGAKISSNGANRNGANDNANTTTGPKKQKYEQHPATNESQGWGADHREMRVNRGCGAGPGQLPNQLMSNTILWSGPCTKWTARGEVCGPRPSRGKQ